VLCIKVDKTNTAFQLFFKNKQYIKSRIYEHASLRFKWLAVAWSNSN